MIWKIVKRSTLLVYNCKSTCCYYPEYKHRHLHRCHFNKCHLLKLFRCDLQRHDPFNRQLKTARKEKYHTTTCRIKYCRKSQKNSLQAYVCFKDSRENKQQPPTITPNINQQTGKSKLIVQYIYTPSSSAFKVISSDLFRFRILKL